MSLHAWTGYDTTSSIFEHGKTSLLRKIEKNKCLQQQAEIFQDENASKDDVIKAG